MYVLLKSSGLNILIAAVVRNSFKWMNSLDLVEGQTVNSIFKTTSDFFKERVSPMQHFKRNCPCWSPQKMFPYHVEWMSSKAAFASFSSIIPDIRSNKSVATDVNVAFFFSFNHFTQSKVIKLLRGKRSLRVKDTKNLLYCAEL